MGHAANKKKTHTHARTHARARTHTHTEYVVLIIFLRHQWLHGRTPMLCYTHTATLVVVIFFNVFWHGAILHNDKSVSDAYLKSPTAPFVHTHASTM